MSTRHEARLARTVVLGALLTVSIVLWQAAAEPGDGGLDVDGVALELAADELDSLPTWEAPRRVAPVASPEPEDPTGEAEPKPTFDLKDGEFVLIGRAVDEYGRPIPGARVQLEHGNGFTYDQAVTFAGLSSLPTEVQWQNAVFGTAVKEPLRLWKTTNFTSGANFRIELAPSNGIVVSNNADGNGVTWYTSAKQQAEQTRQNVQRGLDFMNRAQTLDRQVTTKLTAARTALLTGVEAVHDAQARQLQDITGVIEIAQDTFIPDEAQNPTNPQLQTKELNELARHVKGRWVSFNRGNPVNPTNPTNIANPVNPGSVYGGIDVAAASHHRAPVLDETEVVADANGWFTARGHWVDGLFNRNLSVRMTDADGNERLANATLQGDTDGDRLSAGRVMLRRLRLVAAGRVLDDQGRPIAGAQLVVNGKNVPARTDANGEFIFKSRKDYGAEVDLIVRRGNHAAWSLRKVEFGTDDLDITLPRYGRVDGRIFVDGDARIDDLHVQLIPADVDHTIRPKRMKIFKLAKIRSKRGDYRFDWRKVPPGTWHVRIGRINADPVYMIHDVRVEAREKDRDYRLDDIDLRGLLPKRARIVSKPMK